jgi:hypothetical protein
MSVRDREPEYANRDCLFMVTRLSIFIEIKQ